VHRFARFLARSHYCESELDGAHDVASAAAAAGIPTSDGVEITSALREAGAIETRQFSASEMAQGFS
jgi:hypothetical protein